MARRPRVVVVGGGHAGCEAAAAAARMGMDTVLFCLDRRRVAEMPCNPAIGGIGKGHLVAELDALGGIQGWAADRAGIQFRILNAARGPAVWGPRAQCDKFRYALIMRRLMDGLVGLSLREAEVEGVLTRGGRVCGVRLCGGEEVAAEAVVVTTGTFLKALMHVGAERVIGGRVDERSSEGLGTALHELGFELRRFKTGTPPRIHRASIDFAALSEQAGDEAPRPFSWRSRAVRNRCVCWLTRTTAEVQRIIEDNVHRSPLFSGAIEGTGPRYCPSIEDKVVRFPHHREHTVFVEPEGLATASTYLNGLSTSLPRDVQEAVVRAVPGLSRARFLRYGYAVEYDVVAPGQVNHALAARALPGLYFAGQVLGTSGYEEAAALGLVAGINAAAQVLGDEPLIMGREQSYLGVMVDDLVRQEHREPYRMFTSRAEHRLVLGVDTARERLMAEGCRRGLVRETVFHVEQEAWQRRRQTLHELAGTTLHPDRATQQRILDLTGVRIHSPTTMAKVLARPEASWEGMAALLPALSGEDLHILRGWLRYLGYGERAAREHARVARLRELRIPDSFAFGELPGLSREMVEVLSRARPHTLADAERLGGVTPAAVALLAGRLAALGVVAEHE